MTILSSPRGRLFALGGFVLAAAAAIAAVLALTASAKSSGGPLRVASSEVGHTHTRIAVNGRGVAVYTLSGDTTRHRLCTRASGCLNVWPPLAVHGTPPRHVKGISGTLGRTRRFGVTQLTLNGRPLYLFAEDHGRAGEAHGDGIHTFGGTWHVVAAAGAAHGTGGTGGTGGPRGGGGTGGGY